MEFADDNDRPRPMDDMMGGWDIGFKGSAPESNNYHGTTPGRWATRAGPAVEVRGGVYHDLYYQPPRLFDVALAVRGTAVGRYEPPGVFVPAAPIEMIRDILTGETYKFSRLIDDGYAIGTDQAGEEFVLGLLNWERFTAPS